MRASRRSLAVAASMILPATALVEARADEPAGAGRRITVVASPAIIPAGTRCRVELDPEARGAGASELTYEGKVVAADDEGLTLAVSSTRRKDVSHAEAARLPLIGRLFTNVGIEPAKAGEAKDVRIPAEKIRTVVLLRD